MKKISKIGDREIFQENLELCVCKYGEIFMNYMDDEIVE
jgi:hypothetical protein